MSVALPVIPHPHLALSLVSEMITPGILILATGSLINTTLMRLSRTVDRARVLISIIRDARHAGADDRAETNMRWLATYARRVRLLERALTIAYYSIFLFVASTLMIALSVAAEEMLSWLAPLMVILGTCCLFASTAALVIEAQLAAGTLRSEIEAAYLEIAAISERRT